MNTKTTLIRRWVFILNIIRTTPYDDLNRTIVIEDNDIICKVGDDETLNVFDQHGKLLITFSEDGQPVYLDDWAKEPMNFGPYEYPMYEMI